MSQWFGQRRQAVLRRRQAEILLIAAVIAVVPLFGQAGMGRSYGRSMVITQQGIAATSQPLASEAAAEMLARGGSAVDAAITANAVLAVTEPMMNGLGGDCFVLYQEAASGKLVGLNASGPAPRAISAESLRAQGLKEMPQSGIQSVTVPGAVDGWARMHRRYGKLPWRELFQPAIAYAEKGFPVSEVIREAWTSEPELTKLHSNPESTRVFLPDGKAPEVGQLFRNPDLARALRLLAEKGPDAFYNGEIGAAILRTSEQLGGTMTAQDLSSYAAEWVQPISIDYRGWKVYELPPNGQGMAALEMLNIMQQSAPAPEGPFSADEIHTRIEAMKLAYSDVHRYDADPRFHDVPVAALLSTEYARRRAALIDPKKAHCDVTAGEPVTGDTTYLTIVDRNGNIASWIQSNYSGFGSGVAVKGMGFELQNRGGGFTLDPKSPNVLAGGKRPFHTIIPAFMEKGDLHMGFGIMGGPNQPLAHAQFVSNFVDFGMNIQDALEAPRFFKREASGCGVSIESRLPAATLQQLSERGHELRLRRAYTLEMGRGQAILRDSATKINYAASDPRADGEAVPEPIVP